MLCLYSEDSDSGDDNFIVVKPLMWRSLKVTEMFRDLDEDTKLTKLGGREEDGLLEIFHRHVLVFLDGH